MKKILLITLITFLNIGCESSGPASTNTSSKQFSTLADKVAFLQQYVQFKRSYHKLDFSIRYNNNSQGMLPGPSDWDIQIVAQVPPNELSEWTSGLTKTNSPNSAWKNKISTDINYSTVSIWFKGEGVLVGVDKTSSVVVYRNVYN